LYFSLCRRCLCCCCRCHCRRSYQKRRKFPAGIQISKSVGVRELKKGLSKGPERRGDVPNEDKGNLATVEGIRSRSWPISGDISWRLSNSWLHTL